MTLVHTNGGPVEVGHARGYVVLTPGALLALAEDGSRCWLTREQALNLSRALSLNAEAAEPSAARATERPSP